MPRIIIGSRSDVWPGCSEGAPGAFCARAIDPANAAASKSFEPARIFASAGPITFGSWLGVYLQQRIAFGAPFALAAVAAVLLLILF
jgi:hypothetical protein